MLIICFRFYVWVHIALVRTSFRVTDAGELMAGKSRANSVRFDSSTRSPSWGPRLAGLVSCSSGPSRKDHQGFQSFFQSPSQSLALPLTTHIVQQRDAVPVSAMYRPGI